MRKSAPPTARHPLPPKNTIRPRLYNRPPSPSRRHEAPGPPSNGFAVTAARYPPLFGVPTRPGYARASMSGRAILYRPPHHTAYNNDVPSTLQPPPIPTCNCDRRFSRSTLYIQQPQPTSLCPGQRIFFPLSLPSGPHPGHHRTYHRRHHGHRRCHHHHHHHHMFGISGRRLGLGKLASKGVRGGQPFVVFCYLCHFCKRIGSGEGGCHSRRLPRILGGVSGVWMELRSSRFMAA